MFDINSLLILYIYILNHPCVNLCAIKVYNAHKRKKTYTCVICHKKKKHKSAKLRLEDPAQAVFKVSFLASFFLRALVNIDECVHISIRDSTR